MTRCVTPTTVQKVVVIFCIVWPFLAAASMQSRKRSSAPWSAALVAMAVVVCGLWLGLANVVQGLAMSGASPAIADAGIRWALEGTRIAIWPLAWIAILSAVRRHRPQADRHVNLLASFLAVQVLAAFLFAQVLAPSESLIVFARTAAAITVVTAMAAAVRLFAVTRQGPHAS